MSNIRLVIHGFCLAENALIFKYKKEKSLPILKLLINFITGRQESLIFIKTVQQSIEGKGFLTDCWFQVSLAHRQRLKITQSV